MAEGKWISDLAAATPLVDAARRVLAIRLELVRDHLGLALREPDNDPEYVHRLRVATRRASAAVEIFAPCLTDKAYTEARKQLRRIRRAAGEARDCDVFLLTLAKEKAKNKPRHRPGLDFLTAYALAERIASQGHLAAACPDYPFAFERLLAQTVAAVHKPHYDTGSRTLGELAGPLLLNLAKDMDQAMTRDLDDYSHLHWVRILGKRLRYAMEVFATCFEPPFRDKLYPAVEEMQEILGRANDSHVAIGRLTGLIEKIRATVPDDWKRLKSGIEGLLKYHERQLPEERQHFLKWRDQWQETGGLPAFVALLRTAEPAIV